MIIEEGDILHYGKKGMKWGVRKAKDSSGDSGGSSEKKPGFIRSHPKTTALIATAAIVGGTIYVDKVLRETGRKNHIRDIALANAANTVRRAKEVQDLRNKGMFEQARRLQSWHDRLKMMDQGILYNAADRVTAKPGTGVLFVAKNAKGEIVSQIGDKLYPRR